MSIISKVLVVLANPSYENDNRGNFPNKLCKDFMEILKNNGINVDFINLYKDYINEEFDPVYNPSAKDTKIIEYQVKIRKAEVIIFFHPLWNGFMPSILKGFLEKVFVSGFAFSQTKSNPQPFLEGKKVYVFSFSDRSSFEQKVVFRNMNKVFWFRSIFRPSGIMGKFFQLSNIRSQNEKEIEKLSSKILKVAQKFNSKDKILDLI